MASPRAVAGPNSVLIQIHNLIERCPVRQTILGKQGIKRANPEFCFTRFEAFIGVFMVRTHNSHILLSF
jgi:hypothetical protein